ncbi:hypothetical protein MTO96_043306 [Rhipicephalus appendiculatus]
MKLAETEPALSKAVLIIGLSLQWEGFPLGATIRPSVSYTSWSRRLPEPKRRPLRRPVRPRLYSGVQLLRVMVLLEAAESTLSQGGSSRSNAA